MHQTDIGDILRTTARFTTSTASTVTKDPTTVKFRKVTPARVVSSVTYSTSQTTIVKSTTGVYYSNMSSTSSGVYWYRWTSTGVITTSQEGSFQVGRRFVDT